MTPFGLVIVAVIVTLFVVALATPAGRVALIGRARGMVLMLVWLALLALLGTMPRGSVKIPRVWSLETPPPDDRRQRR
ncbi:hypothetical protein ABIF66_011040 [Bradyrhizobium japonicum]